MIEYKPKKHKIFVDDVSLKYSDGTESLRNVTLPIVKNQINVLLGPSGGGKSSLLRLFNRLNDLADVVEMKGRVLYDGENVLTQGYDVLNLRRKIGMVFSRPVSLPMTIRENLYYGPQLAGMNNKKKLEKMAEKALKQAVLWDEVYDRLDTSANALSGGQKQRLCIARVLVNKPDVILLDEPTSGLDPVSTLMVEDSLQSLKEDYTIVLVPHSTQQGARTADFCAFFLQGELVEYNTGEQIFTNPKDERTQNYVEGRFG